MTSHYPMRRQMKALHEENCMPIVFFEHPGYHCEFDHESDERVGSGYARKIARHLAAFTDGLMYGYVVAKFFEIPATGALLLGEERMKVRSRAWDFAIEYIISQSARRTSRRASKKRWTEEIERRSTRSASKVRSSCWSVTWLSIEQNRLMKHSAEST
jgi:hypothetical protein